MESDFRPPPKRPNPTGSFTTGRVTGAPNQPILNAMEQAAKKKRNRTAMYLGLGAALCTGISIYRVMAGKGQQTTPKGLAGSPFPPRTTSSGHPGVKTEADIGYTGGNERHIHIHRHSVSTPSPQASPTAITNTTGSVVSPQTSTPSPVSQSTSSS